MITERDLKLIKYLEDGMILTTSIASDLIYHTSNKKSSLNIAQRRLNNLYKSKQINRKRDSIRNNYVYYIGKAPTKLEHRLKIAEFISKLNTIGFEIVSVQLEFSDLQKIYNFRPDIVIVVTYHKRIATFIVEIDLTKPFSNIDKYNKLMLDRKNNIKTPLPSHPLIVVSVCDKPFERAKCVFKPIQLSTNLENLEQLKYPFIQ